MNTMADEVRVMLQDVFNAFVRMDERLARACFTATIRSIP